MLYVEKLQNQRYLLCTSARKASISAQAAQWLIELGVSEGEPQEGSPDILMEVQDEVADYCPVRLSREARNLIGKPQPIQVHPDLLEEDKALDQAIKELEQAEEKVEDAKGLLSKKVAKILNLCGSPSLGSWPCRKSPLGTCLYEDDPRHDSCLCCGKPSERK